MGEHLVTMPRDPLTYGEITASLIAGDVRQGGTEPVGAHVRFVNDKPGKDNWLAPAQVNARGEADCSSLVRCAGGSGEYSHVGICFAPDDTGLHAFLTKGACAASELTRDDIEDICVKLGMNNGRELPLAMYRAGVLVPIRRQSPQADRETRFLSLAGATMGFKPSDFARDPSGKHVWTRDDGSAWTSAPYPPGEPDASEIGTYYPDGSWGLHNGMHVYRHKGDGTYWYSVPYNGDLSKVRLPAKGGDRVKSSDFVKDGQGNHVWQRNDSSWWTSMPYPGAVDDLHENADGSFNDSSGNHVFKHTDGSFWYSVPYRGDVHALRSKLGQLRPPPPAPPRLKATRPIPPDAPSRVIRRVEGRSPDAMARGLESVANSGEADSGAAALMAQLIRALGSGSGTAAIRARIQGGPQGGQDSQYGNLMRAIRALKSAAPSVVPSSIASAIGSAEQIADFGQQLAENQVAMAQQIAGMSNVADMTFGQGGTPYDAIGDVFPGGSPFDDGGQGFGAFGDFDALSGASPGCPGSCAV